MLKTGRSTEDVRRNFDKHSGQFKNVKRGDDVLDVLRDMVPITRHTKMAEIAFEPDEDILAERQQNEQLFYEELRMAGRHCSTFGRELMVAINEDKGDSKPGASTQNYSSLSLWLNSRI
jgi:hypothetical protein